MLLTAFWRHLMKCNDAKKQCEDAIRPFDVATASRVGLFCNLSRSASRRKYLARP